MRKSRYDELMIAFSASESKMLKTCTCSATKPFLKGKKDGLGKARFPMVR